MADSDGDYVEELSDDETAHQVTRGAGPGTRSRKKGGLLSRRGPSSGQPPRKARWEDLQRSWDTVVEGADGSINSTVVGLLDAGKRKR
jgi:transcription initiation factor TFIIH subunit 2